MAKTEKLFTVAGTATNPNGTTKVRFANDIVARVKILTKSNCSNIDLMELPKPMTKLEALRYLQDLGKAGDAGFAITNKLSEKSKLAKRAEVKVAVNPATAMAERTEALVEKETA